MRGGRRTGIGERWTEVVGERTTGIGDEGEKDRDREKKGRDRVETRT